MKRKLIIHVGMGKTGSSSIQKTLRVARPALEQQGIKYLGLMLEHLELPINYEWHKVSGWGDYIDLDSSQANRELAHALQYADDRLPENLHTLIWSNESLFDCLPAIKEALEAVKERYEVEVIGYIRRPDSWVFSAYLQWGIKHKAYAGSLKPFRAWAVSQPWAISEKVDAWCRISIKPSFYNFDAIEDVSSHFVSETLSLNEDVIPSLRENDTPPPPAMSLFACYNSLKEGEVLPDELEPLLQNAGLYQKMQKSVPYNKLLPSDEDISAYVERHAKEIEYINKFFSENKQPVFDLSTLKNKDYNVSPWDSNRALLQLIFHLSKEIDQLKSRLNSFEVK